MDLGQDANLAPFKISEIPVQNCEVCEYRNECAVRDFVNKMSRRRDGSKASKLFSCNIFKEKAEVSLA